MVTTHGKWYLASQAIAYAPTEKVVYPGTEGEHRIPTRSQQPEEKAKVDEKHWEQPYSVPHYRRGIDITHLGKKSTG